MDLTNKDKKQVIKAVLNGGGVINMVVRRRKSLGGRVITPLHINVSGHKGNEYKGWMYMFIQPKIKVYVLSLCINPI